MFLLLIILEEKMQRENEILFANSKSFAKAFFFLLADRCLCKIPSQNVSHVLPITASESACSHNNLPIIIIHFF